MIDLTSIAPHLTQKEPGIWFAARRGPVSYPESGNATCFQLEDESFWFRHRNRCILELLRGYPPPAPMLDIGGGNGYVARAIEAQGFSVALLEPGVDGARAARHRGVSTVICGTLEDVALLPESVGAAGLFDVLEHIADERTFLRRIYKALRPGGRIYLTVPANPHLWSAEDEMAGHFRRYTPPTLREPFEGIGFCVEYLTSIFWLLPIPILLFRSLPSRVGLRPRGALSHSKTEHLTKGGPLQPIIRWLQSGELIAIRRRRTIFVGASLLMVATKPHVNGRLDPA